MEHTEICVLKFYIIERKCMAMLVKSKTAKFLVMAGCMAALLLVAGGAFAAEAKIIKIGTIFPLTGPAAVSGQNCLAAVETAVEFINNKYDWEGFPLASKEGLLDGYKIVLVKADHQGKPDVAKSEAERLYEQEGVFAIIGSYNSSSSKPASAVAERLKKIFM